MRSRSCSRPWKSWKRKTPHRAAEAGEDELDLYDRRRRPINIEFVQAQTVNNKKRLEERDPAVRAANFEQLRATAADPERHREFLLRTSLIASVRKNA